MQTLFGINKSLYNEQTASYIDIFNLHVSVEYVQEFVRMLQYFNPLEVPQTGIHTLCISLVDTDGAVSNRAPRTVIVHFHSPLLIEIAERCMVQCPFSPAVSPPELSCPSISARMKACLII